MLYLNALLGLGTALAPVLVAVFLGLGVWWGLPLLVAVADSRAPASSASGLPLTRRYRTCADAGARDGRVLPPAFWLFAAFALLYGIVETTSGNWSTLYMTGHSGPRRRWPRSRSPRSGRW